MSSPKTKIGLAGAAAAAIIAAVVSVEGGFTQDPKDRGNWTTGVIGQGELKGTKYGISAMSYPTVDIKNLSQDQATALYIMDYVNKPGFDGVILLSPAVGHKVVDAGVNVGSARSSRWFQQSLNSLSRDGKDYPKITVDGKIGTGSINAYASLQRVRGKVKACELVIKLIDSQQGSHYMSLTGSPQYIPGWIDHRVGNVSLAKCLEDK